MEVKDIFFPVTKLPVPPDEVDLIRIVLLESILKKDESGNVKQFQKVYYETTFEGNKISEGNNIIPSELIPYIFDAKNNVQIMDIAMQSFGFAIKKDIFANNPDLFKNPYIITNNNLTIPNHELSTEQPNPIEQRNDEPSGNEPSSNEPSSNEPSSDEPISNEPSGDPNTTVTPAN